MERSERLAGSGSGGFLAGLTAGVLTIVAMLVTAQATGQPSVAETVAEAIAGLTPVEVIEAMIGAFGGAAKRILFVSVLAGQLGLAGLLGIALARQGFGGVESWAAATAAGAAVGVFLLPLLGAGVLASTTRAGASATITSLAVSATAFAVAYQALTRYLNPAGMFGEQDAASRRGFLRSAFLAVGGLVVGVGTFRWLADRLAPPEVGTAPSIEAARAREAAAGAPSLQSALAEGLPGLSPEITPNDQFYVVSKNVFRDPEVSASAWRLEIAGAVQRPYTLTYEELKGVPSTEQNLTLQCISNEIGGNLIGNALWRGVPLKTLLDRAGVGPNAVDVILRAADDYSDSIPIYKAMQPGTLLVYEMNGEVLPKSHGFPARLLVPDIYGMKNVKWLTKVEVVEYDYKGYWMVRGWSDVATMNTTSRIDVPKNRSRLLAGPNYIGGIAVAGERGIQTVEVSADGGRTWQPATVKPALSPYSWVLWLYQWDMPEGVEGPVRLLVRATDGTGTVQTATIREALPDGATGLHAVVITQASPS